MARQTYNQEAVDLNLNSSRFSLIICVCVCVCAATGVIYYDYNISGQAVHTDVPLSLFNTLNAVQFISAVQIQ